MNDSPGRTKTPLFRLESSLPFTGNYLAVTDPTADCIGLRSVSPWRAPIHDLHAPTHASNLHWQRLHAGGWLAGDGFFTWVHRGILGAVPVSVCVTQEEHVEEELFPGNCNEGLRFRLLSIIVTSNKDAFLLPNLYDAMFLRVDWLWPKTRGFAIPEHWQYSHHDGCLWLSIICLPLAPTDSIWWGGWGPFATLTAGS